MRSAEEVDVLVEGRGVITGLTRAEALAWKARCEARTAARRRPRPARWSTYRLEAAGRVLYVGSTRNLRARMRDHDRRWGHLFDAVAVEDHPDEVGMLAAEAEQIDRLQPPLNFARPLTTTSQETTP